MKLPRYRWLLLAPLLFLAVSAGTVLFWPHPPPRRAAFEEVRAGMTREEVYAVVGTSPDSTEGPVYSGGRVLELWEAPDASLLVWFDGDRVYSTALADPDYAPTLTTRFRSRLGLR